MAKKTKKASQVTEETKVAMAAKRPAWAVPLDPSFRFPMPMPGGGVVKVKVPFDPLLKKFTDEAVDGQHFMAATWKALPNGDIELRIQRTGWNDDHCLRALRLLAAEILKIEPPGLTGKK